MSMDKCGIITKLLTVVFWCRSRCNGRNSKRREEILHSPPHTDKKCYDKNIDTL